jgi:hypothetical protein
VSSPTYPLEEIKRLVAAGEFYLTTSSMDSVFALGFDFDDVPECILDYLDDTHFYKTMVAEKCPGRMQDVYRVAYRLVPIYLKLQISIEQKAVVISFKEDVPE